MAKTHVQGRCMVHVGVWAPGGCIICVHVCLVVCAFASPLCGSLRVCLSAGVVRPLGDECCRLVARRFRHADVKLVGVRAPVAKRLDHVGACSGRCGEGGAAAAEAVGGVLRRVEASGANRLLDVFHEGGVPA